MAILVDSCVILDVMTNDPVWGGWSTNALAAAAERARLVINPIIYAEVSVRFTRIEDLEAALPLEMFVREALPFEASFLAGKAFLRYRSEGGTKTMPLPDFFIGAHAAVSGHEVLTRDVQRIRRHYPKLVIIEPTVQG